MATTEMGHLFSCPANVYRAPKASGFQEDRAQRDGEAGERRAGCHTTREPCAPGRSRRGVPPGGRGQGTGTVSPYLECRVSAGERVCLGSQSTTVRQIRHHAAHRAGARVKYTDGWL